MSELKTVNEIMENEIKQINDRAKKSRRLVKALSTEFTYSVYWSGYATVSEIANNFEEYLELSSRLPIDNEMHHYDLDKNWDYDENEYVEFLVITHTVVIGHTKGNYGKVPLEISYKFRVKDVVRTLHKLTEGKCKIEEKVIKAEQQQQPQEQVVRRLSCRGVF